MSGVFMDGGSSTFADGGSSFDGGSDGGTGTYLDGATIDSTSYLNSGGGEGYLHVHTGEGINHAPIMDHANHFDHRITGGVSTKNGGFLAHLLGLDPSPTQPGVNQAQVGRPGFWSSTLQAIKFADLTQGLAISPAFGMLLVFIGFASWLFVVYFIRHNEPMADQVLGKAPPAAGVYSDRRLMNQVRHAMPMQFSHDSGTVYEPLPGGQLSTVEAMKHPPIEETRYAPSRFSLSTNQPTLLPAPQLNDSSQYMPASNGFLVDGYNVAALQTPNGTKVKYIANH